ncbi:MAG TPA: hypothetical protein VHE83_01505 [Mycobacteriales bacterium]|nr:hypothetical protein [Mycobacteriales bacterium]
MSGTEVERATWQAGIDYVEALGGKRFHGNDFTAYVTDRVVAETGQPRNEVQAGFARTALRAAGVIRQIGDGWWQPTGETTTAEDVQATWENRPRPAPAAVRAPSTRSASAARTSARAPATPKAPPKAPLCPWCHYRHEGGREECLH